MDWLGRELNYKTWEDWYGVTNKDITNHGGVRILNKYGWSPLKVLHCIYPEHDWAEWKFDTWNKKSYQSSSLSSRSSYSAKTPFLKTNELSSSNIIADSAPSFSTIQVMAVSRLALLNCCILEVLWM